MTWILSSFADEAGPSCEDQIKASQQAGLKYIDIRSMDGHNITAMPVEHAKGVRAKLDKAGMKVNMFGSPLGKIDIADDLATDLQKLRHLGALAPILGCNAVRIFSYYNKKGMRTPSEWQAASLRHLRQLIDVAKAYGLILYHENESHIFGDKCADVKTLATELRAGAAGTFRTIFDFGNYNAGRENVWECWQQLRDVTDAIHLKDNVWDLQNFHHVPVGQGDGQVEKILADAVARGWQGPLTVEPHLQHSAAVVATGPSGLANQTYSKMTGNESFQIACKAAKHVMEKVKAPVI